MMTECMGKHEIQSKCKTVIWTAVTTDRKDVQGIQRCIDMLATTTLCSSSTITENKKEVFGKYHHRMYAVQQAQRYSHESNGGKQIPVRKHDRMHVKGMDSRASARQ